MAVTGGDELIVFAEDDSTIKYYDDPVYEPRIDSIPTVKTNLAHQRVGLLNWTTKTKIIVEKLCTYLPNESELEVFVSALNDEMENAKQSLAKSYPRIKISIKVIDFNELKELEFINPQSFDSILILSPGGSTIEEMDAYVLSLIHI